MKSFFILTFCLLLFTDVILANESDKSHQPTEHPGKAHFEKPKFEIDEIVEVKWGKRYWKAKILEMKEIENLFFVDYDDYDEDWNEWAPPQRIRKIINNSK